MEFAVAKVFKPSLRREFFKQTLCEQVFCLNANTMVGGGRAQEKNERLLCK
ncbi:hypothetical protein SESBI_40751 [Sesbania bispinosa]|nr:hypothetical protein SESBI_40751 [Sesbania bispinosa]